jgi:hypothetical protein
MESTKKRLTKNKPVHEVESGLETHTKPVHEVDCGLAKHTKPVEETTNLSIKDTIFNLVNQLTSQIETLQNENIQITNEHNVHLEELKETHKKEIQDKDSIYQTLLLAFNELENKSKKDFLDLKNNCKTQVDAEINAFKDVSILNGYIKEIYQLKNDNNILLKRLESNKKSLELVQKEQREQKEQKLKSLEPLKQEPEVELIVDKVKELQPDVSTFDVVEIDDKEYYLDLDNNIRDKETLEILGSLTEDGDAIFK